jgi:CubicO group peptidase (beta-lactamase class C family)
MLNPSDSRAVGLSPRGLSRLRDAVTARVEDGRLPGAVVLVARRGGIAFHEAFGMADPATDKAMALDAIFRVASMTKPLVSLLTMMLVERGEITLATPIDEPLTALKELTVGVERPDGTLDRRPPRRQPTVLDLLRHTAGFSYDWYGESAVTKLYRATALRDEGDDPDAYLAKVAALPLKFDPGEGWAYGISTDILGAVIEAVTGQRLDVAMEAMLTGPLGMADTRFHLPPDRLDRLAATVRRADRPMPDVSRPPARCSGGGGMLSTAMDYARFCQFWLDGGAIEGERLVSRKTLSVMGADAIPPGVAIDTDTATLFGPATPIPANGLGFGLGFSVQTAPGGVARHGSVGTLDWMGVTGCAFFIDPAEDLFAIMLSHASMQMLPNMYLLRALTYAALDD